MRATDDVLAPEAAGVADGLSAAEAAACALAGVDWLWTADEEMRILAWRPTNDEAARRVPAGRRSGVVLRVPAVGPRACGGRFRDLRTTLRDATGEMRTLRFDGLRSPGGGAAWRGAATDVTGSADATEATRLRELIQAVFDAQDSAICVYDAELRLVAYNRKILEYQPHLHEILPIEGRRFDEILAFHRAKGVVSEADALAIERRVRELGAEPHPPSVSVWNGRTYRFHDYPLPSGGFVGVRVDVTDALARERELLEAKEHAVAANRAKSEFLASMSHELRTPLNAVIGFSELVLSEAFGPIGNARYAGYLRDIRHSGQMLLELIGDILDMARIEAGKREVAIEPFDLAEVLREAAMVSGVGADGRGVAFHVGDAGPAAVAGDRRATLQILLNLLSNAVKFTPHGGAVKVSVEIAGDMVAAVVRDTGPGVPEEVLERLGETFVRAKRGALASAPGTGLGLAISRALAVMQEGRLEIANAPEGGAVARLFLRRADG